MVAPGGRPLHSSWRRGYPKPLPTVRTSPSHLRPQLPIQNYCRPCFVVRRNSNKRSGEILAQPFQAPQLSVPTADNAPAPSSDASASPHAPAAAGASSANVVGQQDPRQPRILCSVGAREVSTASVGNPRKVDSPPRLSTRFTGVKIDSVACRIVRRGIAQTAPSANAFLGLLVQIIFMMSDKQFILGESEVVRYRYERMALCWSLPKSRRRASTREAILLKLVLRSFWPSSA